MTWQLNNTTDTLYNWVPLDAVLTFAPIVLVIIIIIAVILLPIRGGDKMT